MRNSRERISSARMLVAGGLITVAIVLFLILVGQASRARETAAELAETRILLADLLDAIEIGDAGRLADLADAARQASDRPERPQDAPGSPEPSRTDGPDPDPEPSPEPSPEPEPEPSPTEEPSPEPSEDPLICVGPLCVGSGPAR